ncbi:N4-(beta-N-acetylglucosaminyl)-L-asparaginase [Pseudarcicella hirudinis]|uniref:N4-(Beta-N-acetylglucosaminyl)-L-asparaginase n=1 Tax=Pseudarcicella hirudinis TaxID=1079859 RepID=A0A1I5VRB6_9BACT|nr:N(4)-(beta-N-acetylglucosaminyl)-L-asparaginase [Pseudarcicella hirudinis]SFQ09963.1 N4-(beta-N-acetylglucosaminyl)-L-asparaginase [Pseudarcicella hirudinis]
MKRRTFLKTTTISAIAPALVNAAPKKNAESVFPMIISTWKNEKANEAGLASFKKSGRALDAVEAAARIPEADPNDTSVGYGGFPDRDGHVTLDACIMDEKGNAGSVTFLEGIMHPISVARAVMEKTPHVMLSGEGAFQFAIAQGFKKENLLTEKAKKAWEEWKKESKYEPKINIERHDTIGILALGTKGEISGACSTSGLAFKMHGRVGDSPVIGAAVFCDDEVGGACATGLGEFVLKTLGSFLIVELMRNGKTPQQACEEAIMRIVKRYKYKEFQIGYLAINKKGEYGAYAIQKGFNYTISQNGLTKVIESDSYMK